MVSTRRFLLEYFRQFADTVRGITDHWREEEQGSRSAPRETVSVVATVVDCESAAAVRETLVGDNAATEAEKEWAGMKVVE